MQAPPLAGWKKLERFHCSEGIPANITEHPTINDQWLVLVGSVAKKNSASCCESMLTPWLAVYLPQEKVSRADNPSKQRKRIKELETQVWRCGRLTSVKVWVRFCYHGLVLKIELVGHLGTATGAPFITHLPIDADMPVIWAALFACMLIPMPHEHPHPLVPTPIIQPFLNVAA